MASEPESWSFVSNGSPKAPEPQTQPLAHSSPDPASATIQMADLVVPPPNNAKNNNTPGAIAWQLLTQALRDLEWNLDIFPPLRSAVAGLVACVDRVQLVQKNQHEYQKLASDLAALAGSLQAHLPDGQPTRMPYSISNIVRTINEQTDYIKQKQERHALVGFLAAKEDSEETLKRYQRIEALFRQLQVDISLSTWTLAHRQWVDAKLKDLAPAHDAFYNSNLAESMMRRGCTQNTRKDVLDGVQGWVQDPDSPNLYWMNGMAGTGKTTIAYSLCERLELEDRMGASFFCSRSSVNCNDVNRIIPTIAYQLGHYSNPYQTELCKVLEKELDVARRKIDVQFKKLMLEPLVKLKNALPKDVVIVIDALDECADSNGMRLLLDLVFQHAAELPIKFFITSRPEPAISHKIMQHESPTRSILHLHDIEKSLVQADIQAYLVEALAPIHPDTEVIEQLANRAGCLFIFAATVVRYIAPQNPTLNHCKRLSTVLQATSAAEKGSYKEVDDLYSMVLANALEDPVLEDSEKGMRRLVLWTAVCAREPLNTSTLAEVFDIEEQQELRSALEPLRSVLHVLESSGVISTLHASFPDFLLSDARAGRFVCDKARHEEYLAAQSFIIMAKKLQFNICNLESSYLLDADIPNLANRVEEAISLGLAYACRYWGDHLTRAEPSNVMTNFLDEFLKGRFLFWMEAMNLKRWMSHAEGTLAQVLIWLPKCDELAELRQFVYDARNFVTSFATNKISLSTPHIYISALPFTSNRSRIWSYYWPLTRGLVTVDGAMITSRGKAALASWSTESRINCLALTPDGQRVVSGQYDGKISIWSVSEGALTLGPPHGHQGAVYSVVVSPDGTRIASGSADFTIIIWNVEIGSILAGPLHGHTNSVPGLAFSPNGSYLVSGSEDHTMRMWDGHNGTWLGKLFNGHTDCIMSVKFSPDGKRIASGSDDRTIRVWDPETYATIAGPFVGHTDWIDCIAFSPDGQRIVSSSRDRTVRVWDSYSGETVAGPFEGHTDRVYSVAFSPDGTRVASGSLDHTVCVWDSHDGRLLAGPFDGDRSDVKAVVFSADGTRVYSGSDDGTICVWDARGDTTGSDAASGHTGTIRGVAFSPDGTHAASTDGTVCVWDTQSGALVTGPLMSHEGAAISVAFSPDGARIVSGTLNSTLSIWDALSGARLAAPFEGHTDTVCSVRFSPDGNQIASGSGDGTIRLWNSHTGTPIAEPFSGHTATVLSVAFSPDGARIVSGSYDSTVRMWDATGGNSIWVSFTHNSPVGCVVFSPDGARVVCSPRDCMVCVLDARDGAVLHGPVSGPTDWAWPLALSPDGASAISVSHGHIVHVWGGQGGNIIAGPLQGYGAEIWSVAFSPDGTRAISGDTNGMLRVWDIPSAIQSNTPLFRDWSINYEGWLIDSDSRHVLWVPSDLRHRIWLPSSLNPVVMGGACRVSIDGASLVGDRWGECYDASQRPILG